jgi:hypothetical protein
LPVCSVVILPCASNVVTVCRPAGDTLEALDRGVKPHIRRRGEPPLIGHIRGKPRRWVVERTNSWHNSFRGLRTRWERKAERYGALVELACAIIILQAVARETNRS